MCTNAMRHIGVILILFMSGESVLAHAGETDTQVFEGRRVVDRLEDGKALSLNEAILNTLKSNPELLAFNHQLSAQEGRELQASLRPNPELSIAVEDGLGTGEFEGVKSLETTVSIGWVLERGVRQHIMSTASAGTSLLAAEREVLRMDTAAETARRFLSSLAYQAQLVSTLQAVKLAEQTVQAVEKRVQAGKAPNAELGRAEAELAKINLQHEDVQHELLSAYYRLAAQWGASEPGFSQVQGDLLELPRTDSFRELKTKLQRNPDINRLLTKQRLNEAKLSLATAQRKPNWKVSVGVRRFEAFNDQALIAGLSIPLTFNNRNQGNIRSAQAELARSDADTDAERIRIETSLFVLYQVLRHSFHRVDTLRDDVIPRLEKALIDTRKAYELGRYSYFEWRTVQADLLAAREELVAASTSAHSSVIEIERLTGVQITQPGQRRRDPS
jgi:cobalt-zinc-cadmium efflux system outer membrane protein